jgi:hypothetical protein
MAIMGPILDTVVVSHDVECMSYKELGDASAHFYCAFLWHLRNLAALPPRLLHHGAIKLAVAPAQPTSSHTISHHVNTSFPMAEKKER